MDYYYIFNLWHIGATTRLRMEIIIQTFGAIVIIALGIAIWKFYIPKIILSGVILLLLFLGLVGNELSKGISINTAFWSFIYVGLLGVLLLLIGLFIRFKKK